MIRIFTTAICILIVAIGFAQTTVTLNASDHTKKSAILDAYLDDYSLLSLSMNTEKIQAESDQFILDINIKDQKPIIFDALRNNVWSGYSALRLITPYGEITQPNNTVKTYTGHSLSEDGYSARITMSEDYFHLMMSNGTKTFIIENLKKYDHSAQTSQLVVYQLSDLIAKEMPKCGGHNPESIKDKIRRARIPMKSSGCRSIDLGAVVDFALYQKHDQDVEATIAEIASVMNTVDQDYQEFTNGLEINFSIAELSISTCAECDRWTSSNDINTELSNFHLWTNTHANLSTSDIIGLFSGISFDSNFSGLAYKDVLCDRHGQFVVKLTGNSVSTFRALVSHEIGHVFGCEHNYEIASSCHTNISRPGLLMDPVINGSITGWSTGVQDCALNSEATIAIAANLPCTASCSSQTCEAPSNLSASFSGSKSIDIQWSGSSTNYIVQLYDEATERYLLNTPVSGSSYFFTGDINPCEYYQIRVLSDCGTSRFPATSAIVQTNDATKIDIESVKIIKCTPSATALYDLEVKIRHNGGNSAGIEVDIDGIKKRFAFHGNGQNISQTLTIRDLPATGASERIISVYAVQSGGINCTAEVMFNIPTANCDIIVIENFDFCDLPGNWSTSSTNALGFADRYEWKFANENRPILNFANANNANRNKTINGSCMAYFDDDVNSNQGYTGNISLESESFDYSGYSLLYLDFSYIFNNFALAKGANNSSFYVEAFDGYLWHEIYREQNDSCPFHDVWADACTQEQRMDLSDYINANFKLRFSYTDGNDGKWTGMIALDDVEITAIRGAVLPLEVTTLDAYQKENTISIDWTVLDELNVDHYEVDRWDSQSSSFRPIGSVASDGNSKYSKYQLTDHTPLFGENLYRLTPIGKENNKYSARLTTAAYQPKDEKSVSVYPNPTSDKITIALQGYDSQLLTHVQLFDMQGAHVKTISDHRSAHHIVIDMSELPSGIYQAVITQGQDMCIRKIIKR